MASDAMAALAWYCCLQKRLVLLIVAVRVRRALDPCIPPSQYLTGLPSGTQGCSSLAISPDGRYIAAACLEDLSYPVGKPLSTLSQCFLFLHLYR